MTKWSGLWRSAAISPAGSGAEPQPKSNLMYFSLKIWHLVATILIIFLIINWSNLTFALPQLFLFYFPPEDFCCCQHQHASEKNSSFARLLEETCCKMNKTTYFYPNFLKFQIMCCGPPIAPSRAACGREFETPVIDTRWSTELKDIL